MTREMEVEERRDFFEVHDYLRLQSALRIYSERRSELR